MFGIIAAGLVGVVVGAVVIGGWMAGEQENRQWEIDSLNASLEFWRKAYHEARDNSYSLEESVKFKVKENDELKEAAKAHIESTNAYVAALEETVNLLQQDVTAANDYATSLEEELAAALVHIVELELQPLLTTLDPPFEAVNQTPDPKADVKPKAKKAKKAKK